MKNATRFPHLVSSCPVLNDLSEAFKIKFLEACTARTFDQGETILAQGQTVPGMYIIAHGSIEITSFNSEGQTVLIHLHQQGDMFGDVETLSERPAIANCTAANKAIVLFLPKKQMFEFLNQPLFVRNLFRETFDRLVRDNTTKFVDQFYPVEQRLCDYLYRLSADRDEISKTQADLAGLLGCARQTLNRELGRLRDKDILMMEKGKIRVIDRPALYIQATTPHRSNGK